MTQQSPSRPIGMMVGLGLIALLFLAMGLRGCWITPPWFEHGLQFPFALYRPFYGFLGIWGLIQVALAIWVGVDAHRRGLNGLLWGLLVLFTHIVGLIVYLLVAPTLAQRNGVAPAAGAACPGCRARIQSDFKVCPYCGVPLGCGQCGSPLEQGWKNCPQCGASVGKAASD